MGFQEDCSEWNVDELSGFMGEKKITEVMIKTGLTEDDEKGLEKVEPEGFRDGKNVAGYFFEGAASENWVESLMNTTAVDDCDKWPPCSWSAFEEEEPMIGWIWYPYTAEELMSFEDEEVVWEHALWNWKDINGIPTP